MTTMDVKNILQEDSKYTTILEKLPKDINDIQLFLYLHMHPDYQLDNNFNFNNNAINILKEWCLPTDNNYDYNNLFKLRPLSYKISDFQDLFKYCSDRKQLLSSSCIEKINGIGLTVPNLLYNFLNYIKQLDVYILYTISIICYNELNNVYINDHIYMSFIKTGPQPPVSNDSLRNRWLNWNIQENIVETKENTVESNEETNQITSSYVPPIEGNLNNKAQGPTRISRFYKNKPTINHGTINIPTVISNNITSNVGYSNALNRYSSIPINKSSPLPTINRSTIGPIVNNYHSNPIINRPIINPIIPTEIHDNQKITDNENNSEADINTEVVSSNSVSIEQLNKLLEKQLKIIENKFKLNNTFLTRIISKLNLIEESITLTDKEETHNEVPIKEAPIKNNDPNVGITFSINISINKSPSDFNEQVYKDIINSTLPNIIKDKTTICNIQKY
jgi:hypothetical protein